MAGRMLLGKASEKEKKTSIDEGRTPHRCGIGRGKNSHFPKMGVESKKRTWENK